MANPPPFQGAGLLSVDDADILITQVNAQYMDMWNIMSNDPRVNWVGDLLESIPMEADTVILPWQEVLGNFREWSGTDKKFYGMKIRSFRAKATAKEFTLRIDRRQGLQKILSKITNLVANLSRATAAFWARLTAKALLDGEVAGASYKGFKPWDKGAAFRGNHPIHLDGTVPGTWSNLYTNRGLTLENLEAAIHDFAKTPAPDGESLACFPTHLIVSGAKSETGKRLLQSDTIGRLLKDLATAAAAASERNFHKDQGIKLVIAHQLTNGFPNEKIAGDPTSWYLVDRSMGRNPLGKLVMQEPSDMPESGMVKGDTPYIHYGKEASGNVIISQPHFIQKNKE